LNRRRFVGAGVVSAAALAVGCGGGDRSASVPADAATAGVGVPGVEEPRRWAGRRLRVGAAGGEVQQALADVLWRPFAAATGCAIDPVTTDYAGLSAAVARGDSFADLLLVDPIWAESERGRALTQEVGLGGIAPEAVEAFGGGDAGVPAFASALVAAYRRDGITAEAPPGNWREWWDVDRFPGPRTLARDAFGTFEFALLADGVAPDRLYPLDGKRAIESLKEISGRIVERWWDSGREPVRWLGSGRADLASSWHHRVVAGQRDGFGVDLVWSQGLIVADRWVVPVASREPEIALDFVRFALAAETQAALARRIPLGPVVPAAFGLLDGATAARVPTAPANVGRLLRPDYAWWAEHRGDAMQRFNSWLLGTSATR